jgi:uncharacterized repeat protein (TIGR01451 family)
MIRKCCGVLVAVLAIILGIAIAAGVASPGGTLISNVATATFTDVNNGVHAIESNEVTVTTASVGALLVTPNDSSCSNTIAVGSILKETFSIANTGNIDDAYTIASASTTAVTTGSVNFITTSGTTPVTVGSTVSPTIAPGQNIEVQVSVATSGVAVGTHIIVSLTARTTATGTVNGLQSASASQCALATSNTAFSGPGDPKSLVSKLVNDAHTLQTPTGATVTYSISVQNSGTAPALNAKFVDAIPTGVTPDTTSVTINGTAVPSNAVTFAAQTLTVPLGTLANGAIDSVAFNATVENGFSNGTTFVNTAAITADNAPTASTIPATVLIGTADIVYNGLIGGGAPVGSASLELIDHATGTPITISSTSRSSQSTSASQVNTASNPFVTGPDGTYSFSLTSAQLGTASSPAVYDLLITAPGYLNRHILITLTPDATETVATVAMQALDNQQLAAAGGFSLVMGPVSIVDIAGFFGNIPLSPQGALQVTKSADRTTVSGGDRVVFTLQCGDTATTPLGTTEVVDTLPPGLLYAPGSALVDNDHLEPTQIGNVLTWTFPSLSGTHTIVYATVLSPGIEDAVTLTNRVTITAAAANGGTPLSASASADVKTVAGIFSNRIIITGRVYADIAGRGRFVPGDKGIPNVRLYLEDGESAVTDQYGRFSFPAARAAMHVLRLDETTLPFGIAAYPTHVYDDEHSTRRLVHGVFDSGTIDDINFAVKPL